MKIPATNNYVVELEHISEHGTTWIVRVYRKIFVFKKLISSDWFLEEAQAKTFAEHLARELASNGSATGIRERKPGWTLHRAPH